MSNWKNAYGWSGHILVSNKHNDSSRLDNVVAIEHDTFKRIVRDHEDDFLDSRIETKVLGVTGIEDVLFLATGVGFSEGFTYYGTVFNEAELRALPGKQAIDHDAEYLQAMKDVYGLDLPPCRLMIGCSSEH
jgi:hypothetical protein